MFGLGEALGLLFGGLGLLQQDEQGDAQQAAMDSANALNWEALNWNKDIFKRFSDPSLQALLGLAQGYDPVKESRAATDHASAVAQDAIGKALHGFNASMGASGAMPGGSSIEGAQQAAVMKPIAQQLAGIVADAQSNATLKKMGAYQAVLGQAPAGQLGNSYWQAADNLGNMARGMPGANYGPGSQMLIQALQGLFQPGSGGSGRKRYGDGSGGGNQSQVRMY